jgi:hypothetical protein
MCTSSGGWTSKADANGRPQYPWSNEAGEAEASHQQQQPPAAPNGMLATSEKGQHRVAETVDGKDIEKAEHV